MNKQRTPVLAVLITLVACFFGIRAGVSWLDAHLPNRVATPSVNAPVQSSSGPARNAAASAWTQQKRPVVAPKKQCVRTKFLVDCGAKSSSNGV